MSSEHINANQIIIKTPRDFRGLANEIEAIFIRLAEIDYGRYTIGKEERQFYVMAEDMKFVQEVLNKGIKLEGSHGTTIIEVYNYKERKEWLETMLDGFKL